MTSTPDAAAWCNLGAACQDRGDFAAALDAYARARALDPERWEVYLNVARLMERQNQLADAESFYRQLLRIKPDYAPGWGALARLCARLGRLDESVSCFEHALRLAPGADLHCDLAQVLIMQRRSEAALKHARQALALNPRLGLAHCHAGTVLREQGRLVEAKAAFASAVDCDPDCWDAMQKLANTASTLCQWEESICWFVRAMERAPGSAAVHSSLLFTLSISRAVDVERLVEEHKRWPQMHGSGIKRFEHQTAPGEATRKLRIGFVSGDFREHPVRFFIAPLLRHLDRGQFEVICYSNSATADAATAELRALADSWREVFAEGDTRLAQLIRSDRIDILVDLSGHTRGNRLLVFEHKPAPVQVTYLGYPNTTGLSSIDYWLSDGVLHPESAPRCSTEEIWRLPRCWVIYAPPADAPEPAIRNRSGPVTFASFNALQKLTPDTIRLWSCVLDAVPDSKLLVKAGGLGGAPEQSIIRQRFAASGVAPGRVTLIGQVPSQREHLALYGQADIALDTTPFSGGTTTAEALWMGVPVVTLAGSPMVSRMSASMLHAAGLDELIAGSEAEFVAIGKGLASSGERRTELRRELRGRVAASPLCDGRDLATHAGAAFRAMWTGWCNRTSRENAS